MGEEIKDIQNTVWKMYKDFILNRNMKEFNNSCRELVEKYKGTESFEFCQELLMTYGRQVNKIGRNND